MGDWVMMRRIDRWWSNLILSKIGRSEGSFSRTVRTLHIGTVKVVRTGSFHSEGASKCK
jgi:hypothetical protein